MKKLKENERENTQIQNISPLSPKIVVDGMLKNVAKLLRIMGYNVDILDRKDKKKELQADIFITARQNIPHEIEKALGNTTLIKVGKDEPPTYTCSRVVKTLGWRDDMYLSRCLLCGGLLSIPDYIPPDIMKMNIPHDTITWCPKCKKYFWEGTHHDRMKRKVQSILFLSEIELKVGFSPDITDDLVKIYMEAYKGMEEYGESTEKRARKYINWLSRHSTFFSVAFFRDKPVGFVSACSHWWSWGTDEEVGEIHEICVEREKWGLGLGSTLLWLSLEHLREKGMKKFGLWVGEKNEKAIRFYSKFGFYITGKSFKVWVRMEKEDR